MQTHSQSRVGSNIYFPLCKLIRFPLKWVCKPYLRDSLLIQKALRLHQSPNTLPYLWHHFLEWIHDTRALGLLEIGETTRDDHHSSQHHAQVELKKEQSCPTGRRSVITHIIYSFEIHFRHVWALKDLQTIQFLMLKIHLKECLAKVFIYLEHYHFITVAPKTYIRILERTSIK